jgi:hypothetical protein
MQRSYSIAWPEFANTCTNIFYDSCNIITGIVSFLESFWSFPIFGVAPREYE